ncbi:MAG: LamG domain-containing protein [Bacteroidetes bacterium]|nr:LamG domain-containing protein [Bacteroidota bacterium]
MKAKINANYKLLTKLFVLAFHFSLFTFHFLLFTFNCFSQGISINTTGNEADNSAILDVNSTTQGQLVPRMTTAQRDNIAVSCSCTPAEGLQIFNTTTKCFEAYIFGLWQSTYCGCNGVPATPGTITGSATVCASQSGEIYSILPVSGAGSYTWTVPTGANITAGQGTSSATVNFGTTSGNISVTATNNCGTSAVKNLGITVNPNLSASLAITPTPSGTICSGTSVTYTATPTNGGSSPTYQWKVNGSNVGTNSNTFTSTTFANNDAVTCIMTSNADCVTGSPATSNTSIVNVSSLLCNLVSYWKFDESSGDASDATGNGNTLTNNTTTPFASAKINNGANFGTTNTSKYFSKTDNLGFTTNSSLVCSVSAWVYFNTPFGNNDATSILTLASTNNLILIFNVRGASGGATGADLEVYALGTSGGKVCNYNQAFSTGTWYHLVWVLNGASYALYINGSSVSTGSTSYPSTTTTTATTKLGYGTIGVSLSGLLDEVGIWSKALTSTEVTSLYNSGAGLQHPF